MARMIVYACADLFFATRIRSTAERMGVGSQPANDAQSLRHQLHRNFEGKPEDAVGAVVVDLDLGDDALAMIRETRAHENRPTIIAFGSHVATALLQAARSAGADHVMPRSSFTAKLPDIIRHHSD